MRRHTVRLQSQLYPSIFYRLVLSTHEVWYGNETYCPQQHEIATA